MEQAGHPPSSSTARSLLASSVQVRVAGIYGDEDDAAGGGGVGGCRDDVDGRRVGGVVQRGAADAVRGGDLVGEQALVGVLLQPQGAAGLLLPVHQEPRPRPLRQQPQRQEDPHLMRHLPATLLASSPLPARPCRSLLYLSMISMMMMIALAATYIYDDHRYVRTDVSEQ